VDLFNKINLNLRIKMSIRPKMSPPVSAKPSAVFMTSMSQMATANMAHLPTAIPVPVNTTYSQSASLRQSAIEAENAASMGMVPATLDFDQLNPTEQAAASLGVQPNALKPIGWLNDAHHKTLLQSNSLDPHLARRIEAYKVVSKTSQDAMAATVAM
jgi:hypothetical protein